MKLIKVTLLLIVVILTFASCQTTKLRNMHTRELRAELSKYSEVLDLARMEIYFDGGNYLFLSTSRDKLIDI